MTYRLKKFANKNLGLLLAFIYGEKTMSTEYSILNDQFVDMAFITKLTGLTDKWFYKLIKDGEFPKPIKLGRSSRWLESEVEAWLQQRIAQSRQ